MPASIKGLYDSNQAMRGTLISLLAWICACVVGVLMFTPLWAMTVRVLVGIAALGVVWFLGMEIVMFWRAGQDAKRP